MATRRYKILNEKNALRYAPFERLLVLNGFCISSLNAISLKVGGHAAREPMRNNKEFKV